MNVCARLESASKRGHILTSKETADHLKKAGKEAWLRRSDDIMAKGKGLLATYYIMVSGERAGSVASCYAAKASIKLGKPMPNLDGRTQRLIDWNVQMLLKLVKQIVASRSGKHRSSPNAQLNASGHRKGVTNSVTPLDEVKEVIALPEFDASGKSKLDPESVDVPAQVFEELHLLVSEIAIMYNANAFHNFDHASHVVMSVIKLMSRIVAPSHLDDTEYSASKLHDHTYGITSDPLTQFACAFSALIHDVGE